MEFFKKRAPEIKFEEDPKIDKHVDFSLAEKEPSLDDYTDQLNFHAETESLSNNPNLIENSNDGSEEIEQRIKDIKEALEHYESLPKSDKVESKIKELKDILKRIHPDSVLIDPNLN